MDATENTQIVLTFFAALARRDLTAAQAALADGITWWLPGVLPPSGIYKSGTTIFEECVEYESIQVRRTFEEGEYVAVEWVARGKSVQGPRYGNYYHLLTGFTVRNGKIQAIRDHRDMLYAKEVLCR